MIYRVVLDDTIDLHTSDIDCMLLNPSLDLEMNSAGSFNFTLPPSHPYWDSIKVLKSTIDVYEDGDLIFTGRIASIEKNWNNERVVQCEGALAYFNDSIHRQMKWETPLPIASEDPTVHNFLKDILDNHNVFEGAENANRHIFIGNITVDPEVVTREVNYDTTLDILTRMCIDTNGGYMSVRKDLEDGKLYLDWIKDFTEESGQPAQFGLNLLNFDTSLAAEDICTGVLARGAEVNEQTVMLNDVELVDETTYPDMSVTHYTTQYQDILWHREGVEKFGQVVQVHDFSDAQTAWKDGQGQIVANSLFEMAKKWLEEKNTKIETIEVEVAELAWLGEGMPKYKLGQIVELSDNVHMAGESYETRLLPMYKLSCDLNSGSKKVTLGTPPKKELTQISASNSDSSTLSSSGSSSGSGGSGEGEECRVHDVKVDGTSVVSDKVANINLSGKADVSTVNALATTVASKADTSTVNALANVVSGKQNQIEFNTLEAATEVLTRLKADNKVYNLGGGTEVEANPSESATDDLTTIKIGDTVYDIPGGGSGGSGQDYECDLLFENDPLPSPTSGTSNVTRTYTLNKSIDDYDAVYVMVFNYYAGGTTYTNTSGKILFKPEFYIAGFDDNGYYDGPCMDNGNRNIYYTFLDSTHVKTLATRTESGNEPVLYKVYGLKFKSSIDIFNPQIYSEEERVVGTWTDGKPLYQKSVLFTSLTQNNWNHIAHNIANIDKVIYCVGGVSTDDGQTNYYTTGANNAYYLLANAGTVNASIYVGNYPFKRAIVTFQYTKTTDTAGSSHWLSGGVMAVNYTEDEQIIGQWMGKTLYQKTINVGSLSAGQDIQVDAPSNIDKVIRMFGNAHSSNYNQWVNINFPHQNITAYIVTAAYLASTNKINIHTGTDFALDEIYMTLQYTKTTDTAGNPMANILATQKELEEIAYHYREHCYTTLSDYYSTEERVVGRWTDGKPLYQKTLYFEAASLSTGVNRLSHNISNIDHIIFKSGTYLYGDGTYRMSLPYGNDSPTASSDILLMSISSTNIVIHIGSDYTSSASPLRISISIQYTKTTDAAGTGPTPGNLIYLPALYSEEEREVGVWTDGKPIYQKNISIPTIQAAQSGIIISNLGLNIDNCVDIKVRLYKDTAPDNDSVIATASFGDMYFYYRKSEDSIRIDAPFSWVVGRYGNLTIQYTKTTDQPGSGTWTPEGQLAHHYSTSEKIVGTWVDGSTLYEKSWTGLNVTPAYNSWTNIVDVSNLNIGTLCSWKAVGGNTVLDGSGIESCITSGGYFAMERNININPRPVEILTLQYTKTS